MEFKKTLMTTLYTRQKKRHKCKEQTFGLWEKARVGWFERIALKHVCYHTWNRWPVQVWCMKQGPQSQYTGTTPEGWGGEGRNWGFWNGGGPHVHPQLIHIIVCKNHHNIVISLQLKFSSVQSLSHVWFFATPWPAACQASLSFTNSRSLLKLMSIESVIPSNHLILCRPLLLLLSIFTSIRVFSNESVLPIRWPK